MEYQFYEFKAIDSSLSKKDMEEIQTWSSRCKPTKTNVIFEYSYRDFPKDEITVVEKYFDAMVHISSWGTMQLIFKYPKALFPVKEIVPYTCEGGIEIHKKTNYFLLEFTIHHEELNDWIEGDGILSCLESLRTDILNGDYRLLYIIWLQTMMKTLTAEYSDYYAYDEEFDDEELEPNVPAKFDNLNEALKKLVDFFQIDTDLIEFLAKNSTKNNEPSINLESAISHLSENEKNDFLIRLLNDEALLSVKLKQHLKKSSKVYNYSSQNRIIDDLLEEIEIFKKNKSELLKKQTEKERINHLEKLAVKEKNIWEQIDDLILEKNAKSYDEAISLLKELKELAIHKNEFAKYADKINSLKIKNSRLSSFVIRITQLMQEQL